MLLSDLEIEEIGSILNKLELATDDELVQCANENSVDTLEYHILISVLRYLKDIPDYSS